jgi:steroid delta-isomerase-like uncharacterized protein
VLQSAFRNSKSAILFGLSATSSKRGSPENFVLTVYYTARECSKLGKPVSQELNKKIVLDYVDAFNRGDEETLRALFTEDALVYGVLGWGGLAQVVAIWREIKAAFAIHLQVESIIADGEIVAARYIERGTSVGSFRGGPVTGKAFEVVAMEWFNIKDGKIHRRWGARDNAAQMRQMGLPLG